MQPASPSASRPFIPATEPRNCCSGLPFAIGYLEGTSEKLRAEATAKDTSSARMLRCDASAIHDFVSLPLSERQVILSKKMAYVLRYAAAREGLAQDEEGFSSLAEMLALEKDELTFGFIKLTDMAPLAVAYEQGYFLDEGLFVTLEAQANWKVLLDGVIGGQLDGAHMLAGQPLAADQPLAAKFSKF